MIFRIYLNSVVDVVRSRNTAIWKGRFTFINEYIASVPKTYRIYIYCVINCIEHFKLVLFSI